LGLLLSASLYASDGPSRLYFKEFDSPATNYGIAQNCDDDAFGQLFANVSFGDFTFEGVYGTRDKGIPTASYETVFDDPRNRTTDSRGYLELRYQHKFSNEWELTGRLFYDQYDYDGTYVDDNTEQNPPSLTLNKDYAYAKWWGSEVQLTKTLFKHHKLSFGSEFRRDDQQVQGDYDVNPFYLYLDDHRNGNVSGVYVQDDYSIRRNLILSAGVRYDHYGTFGGTTNPRVGLIYSPLEKTTEKLLYGTAFRAPNAYELYYSSLPNIA
jgi:iron complex outermembrane receptor protein